MCLSLSGCPFLQTEWGVARQVDYRPAHARASSRERHSSPAIGRATGSFANSKKQKSHIIRSNSRCPASAQHISSHARLPTSCHLNLRLSSFTAACLFSFPPDTAMRHVQAVAPKGRAAVAQILRVPQDRKGRGQTAHETSLLRRTIFGYIRRQGWSNGSSASPSCAARPIGMKHPRRTFRVGGVVGSTHSLANLARNKQSLVIATNSISSKQSR